MEPSFTGPSPGARPPAPRWLAIAALVLALAAPTAVADRVAVAAVAADSGPQRQVFALTAGAPPGPAADQPGALAADGWSLLLSVAPAAATRAFALDGEALAFLPIADGARWVARTPPGFAAGGTIAARLVVQGAGAPLAGDDVAVERVHVAPTAKLIGKANGHLGPDRLDLGPLGFVGLTEHGARGLAVIDVRADGPAARAGLAIGDVVLALDGSPLAASDIAPGPAWFEHSHEAVFGRALEAAARAGRPALGVEVLRGNDVRALEIQHPFTPARFGVEAPDLAAALDAGFPLRGPLGEALHGDLVAWARANERPQGGWRGTNAVNPALGALALLGTGDPADRARARRALDLLLAANPRPSEMKGLAYWTIAFQGMALCEWHLATGDESVLGWIEEAATWLPTTTHTCAWGMQAFGHGPDGLPYDDKALMAPTAHLLVFDALARRCGVESRIWEHVEPYVAHSWSNPDDGGHGGMGYNASFRDRNEFWSRSGLVALAESLRGDDETGMREPLAALMAERHQWMLNSHAYGEPGAALGLLALSVVDREAFDEVIARYRWRFLAAWEPGYGLRYTTPHMGAPYMGGESVVNLAYLLLAATERRSLHVAGR